MEKESDCDSEKHEHPRKISDMGRSTQVLLISDAQVQMTRELGLNLHKFGKLPNEKQEAWKKPLPGFIEEVYYKRFGRKQPEVVRSIEQMVQDQREKKAERKAHQVKPSEE
jgi:hypothetical protein